MSKIIGIDLGSTASCVCVYENNQPTVIVNENGQRTTKSVVGFKENGEIVVGDAAERQRVVRPKETIYLIKRFMGRTWDEIKDEVNTVSYDIVNDNGYPKVVVNGKKYTPQEISAMILQKMKKIAEDYLGTTVKDCVISCPAYYGDPQRTAIKEAATIAGLNCIRITNEPTCGLIANNVKHGKNIVLDQGGSTKDISVADCDADVIEILSSFGSHMLGGYDMNERLVNYVVNEFKKDNGIDLSNDAMAMSRVREACEKTKIELSTSTTTEINLPYITADATGPKHLVMTVTRAKFEQLIEDLVLKNNALCDQALKDAKLTISDIDNVIFVGGTTRIPLVEKTAREYFKKEPIKVASVDEAVCIGAGYIGHQLSDEKDDDGLLLLDVTPLRLGIMTEGEMSTEIIHENTTIPTRKEMTFTNAVDNQPEASIVLLQGNRPMASQNRQLGTFNIPITPAPRGMAKIVVTVDVNVDGVIKVSAKDGATGQEKNITIDGAGNLSEEEIKRMREEAELNEAEDKKIEERAKKLNSIESQAYSIKSSMNEDAISKQITESQRHSITEKCEAVLAAVKDKDVEKAESALKVLSEAYEPIAKKLYETQQAGSAQGPDMNEAFRQAQQQQQSANSTSSSDEPDIQDADFEEVK